VTEENGAMFMLRGTPTNRTDGQRWALQYHYVGRSVEKVAQEYRLSIFGEEGKDVSC